MDNKSINASDGLETAIFPVLRQELVAEFARITQMPYNFSSNPRFQVRNGIAVGLNPTHLLEKGI